MQIYQSIQYTLRVASNSKWHPFFRLRMSGIMGRPPVYIICSLGYEIMRKNTAWGSLGYETCPKTVLLEDEKSGKHTPKSSLVRTPWGIKIPQIHLLWWSLSKVKKANNQKTKNPHTLFTRFGIPGKIPSRWTSPQPAWLTPVAAMLPRCLFDEKLPALEVSFFFGWTKPWWSSFWVSHWGCFVVFILVGAQISHRAWRKIRSQNFQISLWDGWTTQKKLEKTHFRRLLGIHRTMSFRNIHAYSLVTSHSKAHPFSTSQKRSIFFSGIHVFFQT